MIGGPLFMGPYQRLLFGLAIAVASGLVSVRAGVEPSQAAREAAEEIRHEATLPPAGKAGKPLPLASHWNVGRVTETFEPSHQIDLLQAGHHVLPWAAWPSGDPESERFREYWTPLIEYWEKLRLPISFRGTQWNAMLVKKEYRLHPEEEPWAGVIHPGGERVPKLSPFGDVKAWRDPASHYVDTRAMEWVETQYPDPPLVLWVSNNEPPDLRWHEVEEASRRYLNRYGKGRSDEFKRKVVGDGWIRRYKTMFEAMRQAIHSERWRTNVRFIGYGAFGPSHFGRWDAWKEYSLITKERVDPSWYAWDGGSPSYYTHNWNSNRDHWVFSTQVQSMNWIFMQARAKSVNPDFWFEMSVWDGNQVSDWMAGLGISEDDSVDLAEKSGRPLSRSRRQFLQKHPEYVGDSKALQYMMDGQVYPPERSLGWVQYGMWLLRPRVVREFRSHTTPLKPVKEYWMQTVTAVDRVYENKALKRFWRHGELVRNRAHRHPYQSSIPEPYQEIHRWYGLDTTLDSKRPWKKKTNLPVFSLALRCEDESDKETAEWLVYAHSPLKDRTDVGIELPGFGEILIDVPQAGAFYLIDEERASISEITFTD